MPTVRATRSAEILAPAAVVHAILADYRVGHPAILPRSVFQSLDVLEGGVGAGTSIRFVMKVLGSNQTLHADVTEPEPGRELVETIRETGVVTRFLVEPLEAGSAARATISSEWTSNGLRHLFDRLWLVGFLERTFTRELENLSRIVTLPRTAAPVPHPAQEPEG